MSNPYQVLGVPRDASFAEIKRAFRAQAKRLHPDIEQSGDTGPMRRLLHAYEALCDAQRRSQFEQKYRWLHPRRPLTPFDFKAFLQEEAQTGDGEARARLIFFELVHLREENAINLWLKYGGLNFPLQNYFERGDWMDLAYTLAEELARRAYYYEAFWLLVDVLKAEAAQPYFRHFAEDVRQYLKELVRVKLRGAVTPENWARCLQTMLTLGYPLHEQAAWNAALRRLAAKKPA